MLVWHRISEVLNLLLKTALQSLDFDELTHFYEYRPENELYEGCKCLKHLQSTPVTLEYYLCVILVVCTNTIFNVLPYGVLWQRVHESLTHAVLHCNESSTYVKDGLI
jgi:hypothetical protein